MMTENKQHTRQSIISHLEAFKASGVNHVLRQPEVVGARFSRPQSEDEEQQTTDDGRQTMTLTALRNRLGNCQRCRLHLKRKNIVFGVGNPNATLMFVGEGPGHDEDVQEIGRASCRERV